MSLYSVAQAVEYGPGVWVSMSQEGMSAGTYITPAEAREFAAKLIAAADAVDKRNMTPEDVAKETRERR
ncbi:MAG: hypothetical protein IPJ03_17255 [Ignavibacteriales bacterium]|nr:hypothetical protein [Ignavibacteriales bacterium]